MPQIHVQCSHHLTPAEAAQRLRQFGDKLKQKHVTCDLPFAAMLFRGRIEKDIQSTLSDALAAENAAEDAAEG